MRVRTTSMPCPQPGLARYRGCTDVVLPATWLHGGLQPAVLTRDDAPRMR